jgi:hypothetical protein
VLLLGYEVRFQSLKLEKGIYSCFSSAARADQGDFVKPALHRAAHKTPSDLAIAAMPLADLCSASIIAHAWFRSWMEKEQAGIKSMDWVSS